MVSIEYGGGPTIEQRRAFSSLKEGSHIPGYFPRMEPVRKDEEVRDNTNLWVDNLLKKDALPPHRAPTEAPIPRYMGYVPRSRVTELNLGNRYKVGSERSLKVFSEENKRHFDELKTPGVPCSQREVSQTLRLKPSDEDEVNSRVYHQTGCIPNYTGHVHQNRYQLGNTYGETTRNLDSCYHDYSSYGNYLRSQPPPKYKIKFK